MTPSIDISLKLFAALRESTGVAEEALSVPSGSTVVSVRATLMLRGGAWHKGLSDAKRCRAAVNHQMADEARALEPTDELAFFPPVTGG